MANVEAKGCHDSKGPDAALDRAYKQAERGEIRVRGRRAPFKRYAIATRWGFTNPKTSPPMPWVEDLQVEGKLSEPERDGLKVAMARWHAAALLAPLGLRRFGGSSHEAGMVIHGPKESRLEPLSYIGCAEVAARPRKAHPWRVKNRDHALPLGLAKWHQ